MVKHNNQVPNQHFHKDWQSFVRTWFNQPAKKVARRQARVAKAKKVAPRPVGLLRPVVRCCTNKYNAKVRAGRGFTLDELRSAKINPKEARGVGIAVDHRRKSKSAEALITNVDRLKAYKARLVLFPRNPTSKRIHKADTEKSKRTGFTVNAALPAATIKAKKVKVAKITAKERETTVTAVLRKARTDALLWGRREKREKDKAAAAAGKKKGDAADAPMDE